MRHTIPVKVGKAFPEHVRGVEGPFDTTGLNRQILRQLGMDAKGHYLVTVYEHEVGWTRRRHVRLIHHEGAGYLLGDDIHFNWICRHVGKQLYRFTSPHGALYFKTEPVTKAAYEAALDGYKDIETEDDE